VARLKQEVDARLEPQVRIPRAAVAVVLWQWEQRGRERRHTIYPEERLPKRFKGPIAETRLPLDAIQLPDWLLSFSRY
jgi:hypothetical protein